MADLTYELVGAASGGEYELSMTATAATAMPTEIFVHTYSSRKFSHVATAADLVYPTSPDASVGFYRQDTATTVFDNLTDGLDAKNTNIPDAIQALVDSYNANLTTFLATVTDTKS